MGLNNSNLKQTCIYCLCLFLLAGCMVGPNFHSPRAPHITSYTSTSVASTGTIPSLGAAGKKQYFASDASLPGAWWELFHSKKINQLILKGLKNSPNLAAAKATLMNAQESLNAQIGSTLLPSLSGTLSGVRQETNTTSLDRATPLPIYNLFNASVNVAYTLDIFGGLRRQIEGSQAQVDYQAFQLEAAYLSLTANIVTTAITIASLNAQIAATKDLINQQKEQLRILNQQYDAGGIAQTNVLTQQTLLAQTQSTLPSLQLQLEQNKHALSVLVGEPPNDSTLLDFNLEQLHLPRHLPVSLPSALVRQRPDIRAAEANLHIASANVGVAVANLYPQINLNASYGWQALQASKLFTTATNVWSWGSSVTAPIFNGESLMAKKRAAIAAYQTANAQYKQTILQAFQNVADSLRALEHDAESLKALRSAELSAKRALHLAREQYQYGGVSYLTVLTNMQQYQQARINRISQQATRYADTVALYQALGGGWWKRPCLDTNRDLNHNVAQYR